MIDPSTLNLSALEQQNGLPPGLLLAQMHAESGGNPDAVSSTGAQGLFQFMPTTAKQYGIDPTDPAQSAQGAARMLGDLSKKYNGNLPLMLAAYNWGQGNVDRKGLDNAPDETRNYISKITGSLPQYADSGQIVTDANIDNHPSLDDIFNDKEAKKPSLDDIFGSQSKAEAPKLVEGTGAGRTALEQGLQGSTFGFADEITNPLGAALAALAENPLGTLKSIVTGKTPEVSDSLNESIAGVKNDSKQRLVAQFKEHPLISIASQVGGALGTGGIGASTKGGAAIANLLRGGNALSRVAKGATVGAASGGLFGAGTADEGDRLEGAKQGAISGALVGGAIPAAGAALSDVGGTALNAVKGAFAKSPEAVQDAASALKSGGGAIYNKMRQAGATFKPSAVNGFLLPDIDAAVSKNNFIPALNPKTVAIIDDLKNKAATGNLGLDQLDQYRRLLGRVGGSEDGVSAGAARRAIDDFVNNSNPSHLATGSKAAIDLLNQGRKQYAQASKFETISDLLTNAAGDPNKIKGALTRFLNRNNGNPPGFSGAEVKALKDAASSSGSEKLLKMAGKFGLDLGTSLTPGNTVAPVIGALASGGGTLPILATVARQAQKYAARSKANDLLNIIQSGKAGVASSPTIASPLASLAAGQASALPNGQRIPMRIGLTRMKVAP